VDAAECRELCSRLHFQCVIDADTANLVCTNHSDFVDVFGQIRNIGDHAWNILPDMGLQLGGRIRCGDTFCNECRGRVALINLAPNKSSRFHLPVSLHGLKPGHMQLHINLLSSGRFWFDGIGVADTVLTLTILEAPAPAYSLSPLRRFSSTRLLLREAPKMDEDSPPSPLPHHLVRQNILLQTTSEPSQVSYAPPYRVGEDPVLAKTKSPGPRWLSEATVPGHTACLLQNASVLGGTGVVWQQSRGLLEESINPSPLGPQRLRENLLHRLRFMGAEHVKGRCAVIAHESYADYWHWHGDVIPNFYYLKTLGLLQTTTILVPAELAPWQRDSLRILDPTARCFKTIGDREILCDELYVPPYYECNPARLDSFIAQVYKMKYHHTFNKPGKEESQHRIYILNLDPNSPKMSNENELIEGLKQKGFFIFDARRDSYYDHIGLFSKAQCVVGVHGVGLTNIVFAQELKCLVEIYPDQSMPQHYHRLSSLLGISYCAYIQARHPARPLAPWTLNVGHFFTFLQTCLDRLGLLSLEKH